MCGQLASVVPRLGRCHVTEPLCNIFVPKKANTVFLKGFSAFNFEPSAATGFAMDVVATSPAAAHLWASERSRLSFSCLHEFKLIQTGDKQMVNMLVICFGVFFVFPVSFTYTDVCILILKYWWLCNMFCKNLHIRESAAGDPEEIAEMEERGAKLPTPDKGDIQERT